MSRKRTPQVSFVTSIRLIEEVQKHEILYNYAVPGYGSSRKSLPAWNKVHNVLYPGFDAFDEETKRTLRNNAIRRWKCLRYRLERILKQEDTPRRLRTKQMTALSFMVPFIPQERPECPSESNSSENGTNTQNLLKKQNEQKPEDDVISIKSEPDYEESKDEDVSNFTPMQCVEAHMSYVDQAPNSSSKKNCSYSSKSYSFTDRQSTPKVNGNNEESYSPQSNGEEPSNSTFKAPILAGKNNVLVDMNFYDIHKKKVVNTEDDEDRMFLLSILSDLKKVLPKNKLKVKMKIVQAIVEGS